MIDWDYFWNIMDYEIEKLNFPHRKATSRELGEMIAATGACMGMAQTSQYGVPEKNMVHVFHSEYRGESVSDMLNWVCSWSNHADSELEGIDTDKQKSVVEAHIIPFDEIPKDGETILETVEYFGDKYCRPATYKDCPHLNDYGTVFIDKHGEVIVANCEYGIKWRCWTSFPNQGEREAVPMK